MFSEVQLRQLIAGEVIGEEYPYCTKNEDDILNHMRQLYYEFSRMHNIVCEAEWNHFGSGYASYVEMFLYNKKNVHVSINEKAKQRKEVRNGVVINISRLAPVAIIGDDKRYSTYSIKTEEYIGGGYYPLAKASDIKVSEELRPLAEKMRDIVQRYGYTLLGEKELILPLPFKANIPTIFTQPRDYTIFDAVFYWMD